MDARFDLIIAGEINLDLILYGFPQDLPLDRELLASGFEMTLGSSSAILAHNIALLGTRVGFITQVGDDDMGRMAMQRLSQTPVDLSCCLCGRGRTGVTVLLPHGRTRRILTFPGNMSDLTVGDLNLDYIASARHFHLSSLFLQKGLHAGLVDFFRELRRRGLTLSLDTNDDPDNRWDGVLHEILPLVDVLLPNDDEIRRIARRDTVEESLNALAETVPLIVVKCGSQGALVQHNGRRFRVPGVSVTPVDTIGAGDSFNAGFLSAWLAGAPPETCATAGNITGALSTQRPGGTEAFRETELREAFLRQHQFPRGARP